MKGFIKYFVLFFVCCLESHGKLILVLSNDNRYFTYDSELIDSMTFSYIENETCLSIWQNSVPRVFSPEQLYKVVISESEAVDELSYFSVGGEYSFDLCDENCEVFVLDEWVKVSRSSLNQWMLNISPNKDDQDRRTSICVLYPDGEIYTYNITQSGNSEQGIDKFDREVYNDLCAKYRADRENAMWSYFQFPQEWDSIWINQDKNLLRGELAFCDINLPKELWGKKEIFYKKGITSETQKLLKHSILMREMADFTFSCWIHFKGNTHFSVSPKLGFATIKTYPIGGVDKYAEFSLSNKTDYSHVKAAPIEGIIEGSLAGGTYKIDDYVALGPDDYIVHVSVSYHVEHRYGFMNFYMSLSYLPANSDTKMYIGIIDPAVSGPKFVYEEDENAYNIGYSILNNHIGVFGKQGRIDESAVKYPVKIGGLLTSEYATTTEENGKINVNITKSDGLANIVGTYNVNTLFASVFGFYSKPFTDGSMYIMFTLDYKDFKKCLYLSNESVPILSRLICLVEGAKLGNSTKYDEPPIGYVLKVDDDGKITIRLRIPVRPDGNPCPKANYQLVASSADDITSINLYDFCLSEKAISPDKGNRKSLQAIKYPNLLGKSFTIIGDSELNTGEQFLDTAYDLGMRCFCGNYGGHKWGWAGGNESVDVVTKSWFYTWDIRKRILDNPTDFYILCASTNDADIISRPQHATDKDIQNIFASYPRFGDSDSDSKAKIAAFEGIKRDDCYSMFNATAVLCAYIEQIKESNPHAKIALANQPICATGLLTGELSENNKGQWKAGWNPELARINMQPIYDKIDEQIRWIADKYNLPVLDFYHNVGLTFENLTDYCVDGTHWWLDEQTYVDGSINLLRNYHVIPMREAEIIKEYISSQQN